jgi:hypothetical protein
MSGVNSGEGTCITGQSTRTPKSARALRAHLSLGAGHFYVRAQMQAVKEHAELLELIRWIDENTAGLSFQTGDRNLLAVGCFDVAIEHQAAIALLHSSELYGSAFALLRVLAEALVRGMWLLHCASEEELKKFKRGKIDYTFGELVKAVEEAVGDPLQVLSGFKKTAWTPLNGFTHTGFHQVSRRHKPGRVEASFSDEDLAKGLGVAGALGMIAAGQLAGLSDRKELLAPFFERMEAYAKPAP